MSQVESDVPGLRAAITDGGTKVQEVRREVAGLKAELSDCCTDVNLEQELAKLKDEIRTMKPKPELLPRPAPEVAVLAHLLLRVSGSAASSGS
jgi:hypothetical protein